MLQTFIVLFGVSALIGAFALLVRVLGPLDPKKALALLPTTPLGEAVDWTLVKVQGRAVADGPLLRAPLSGRECIGYRVEEIEGGEIVTRDEVVRDFLVDDGSARARVCVDRLKWVAQPLDFDGSGRRESLLLDGEAVVVRGVLRAWETPATFREPASRRLELRDNPEFVVIVAAPAALA